MTFYPTYSSAILRSSYKHQNDTNIKGNIISMQTQTNYALKNIRHLMTEIIHTSPFIIKLVTLEYWVQQSHFFITQL